MLPTMPYCGWCGRSGTVVGKQKKEKIDRAYHTPSLWRQLDRVCEKVRELMRGFDEMQATFRSMAKLRLTDDEVRAYLEQVFPFHGGLGDKKVPDWILRDRANCLKLFQSPHDNLEPALRGTLWAAYNSVTEYVDHWREWKKDRMRAVCFDRGYQIKARSYIVARKLAGLGEAPFSSIFRDGF